MKRINKSLKGAVMFKLMAIVVLSMSIQSCDKTSNWVCSCDDPQDLGGDQFYYDMPESEAQGWCDDRPHDNCVLSEAN